MHGAAPLHLDGPLVFFGGPYSNLQALDALLAAARAEGVDPASVVSTGDLVAYCADPRAVVARIRAAGVRFVRGNCEDQLARDAADCGCGFAPGGACDRLAAGWYAHARAQLGADERAFLGAAPARLDLVVNGVRIAVVHGAAAQTNRFIFASTPARVKQLEFDALGADVIVAGHSGLPFTQAVGAGLWHNPGALGMPANEGAPRVWYSLVRAGARLGEIAIEHRALDYDYAAAAAAMRRAGLAEDYARALETGLWPGCDALPKAEARAQGAPLAPAPVVYARRQSAPAPCPARLPSDKFRDPETTRDGAARGRVALERLDTLWINTGTLCNLSCATCYIESSPRNDRLAYISAREVADYLDEIARLKWPTRTIGFTGGEPFLNRDMLAMLEDALARGHEALVLTNAMKPMRRHARALVRLKLTYGDRLSLRVSLDHYARDLHEMERGRDTFAPALEGLDFLAREGFRISVAGRLLSGEPEPVARAGYAALFAGRGLGLDAFSPADLVLFPEMDAGADAPEITEDCWRILGRAKSDVMCSSARMVVKRKGAARPSVVACTLLPYDPQFELGATLAESAGEVRLNHPHCATFCVLGAASCSGG